MQGSQLTKLNDERQKVISTIEANAEEWRWSMSAQEQDFEEKIQELQRQVIHIEATTMDVTNEKNQAISSHQ